MLCRSSPLHPMALLALLAVSSGSISCGAAAADRLPAFLDSTARRTGALVQRTWNIADIVEVRRITGTAISEKTRQVAFVVKQSFIDSDDIRYALYVVEPHGRRARKITEGAYLDQLASHPGSDSWTVRGDFGDGYSSTMSMSWDANIRWPSTRGPWSSVRRRAWSMAM